jgi:hypothetical protein
MLPKIVLAPRAFRAAWIAWGLFLLAACVVVIRETDRRPANDAYARGAVRWAAAENLYVEGGGGFIYLPQSALVYLPFALLPRWLEHSLWRVLTIGLFGVGVWRLCRLAGQHAGISIFPIVSLLVIPKTWTCALNGQAAPAMAGLSMIALGELEGRKLWPAAALLALALAVKPLALVLVLLLAALYRPLWVPLAATLTALAAAPFLAASPAYVLDQYRGAISMLHAAAERGLEPAWPQLFSLASLAGIHASEEWQTALRVAAAIGTLAACWWLVRCGKSEIRNSKSEIQKQLHPLVLVYALATCYLLLFNPRTENNSYVLLSPVIGVMAAHSYFVARQEIKAALLTAAAIALIAGHEVCQIVTPGAGFVWVGPLTTLLFACGLLRESLRDAPRAFQSVAHPHDSKLPAPQRI